MIKNILAFVKNTPFSCQISIKFEYNVIFSKKFKIQFHENLPIQSLAVPCARTDRWTDIPKLIVAFPNFVNSPNKLKSYITNVLNFQVEILYDFLRVGLNTTLGKIISK